MSHRLFARGVNAIAALSAQGGIAVDIVTGSVNGEKFLDFLQGSLSPNMMNNCTIHHVQEVVDIVRLSGILLPFLPPYSPEHSVT